MSKLLGRVIRILDEQSLVINLGLDAGINSGDEFDVLGKSETIIDPETNEELGDFFYTKVRLEAIDVQPRYSILAKPDLKAVNVFGFSNSDENDEIEYQRLNVDIFELKPLGNQTDMTIHVGDNVELTV
jgi:hypothetical protein